MSRNNQPCVGLDINGRGSALLWLEGVSFVLLCVFCFCPTAAELENCQLNARSLRRCVELAPNITYPSGGPTRRRGIMFISNISSRTGHGVIGGIAQSSYAVIWD